jgi:hypothetical protein
MVRPHCCTGLPNIKLRGEPVLDLGALVQFTIADYYGRPAHHVIPVEWCVPCEQPSMAKRVKRSRFDLVEPRDHG